MQEKNKNKTKKRNDIALINPQKQNEKSVIPHENNIKENNYIKSENINKTEYVEIKNTERIICDDNIYDNSNKNIIIENKDIIDDKDNN